MWFIGRKDVPLDPDADDALRDQLGIEPYADGLHKFVRDCQTPMTVGLQGEWGSGKTSLMKLVRSKLDAGSVITFWFETWQYGAVGVSDTLGMLLLRDLTDKLLGALEGDPAIYKFRDKMGAAFQAAIPALAGMATSMATRSDRAGEAASAAAGALVSPSGGRGRSDMRACFQELVTKALDTKTGDARRLVVFIDDLDRVPPALAVRLLEVLKNFMDVKDCVFVVACDYEVVREGVGQVMQLGADMPEERRKEKVDAFFHKLFQVQFLMPVGAYKIDLLLREYVGRWLWLGNEVDAKSSKEREAWAASVIPAFLETGTTKGHTTLRADGWFQQLREVVQAVVGTNPRSFKRFLNLVELTSCVDASFQAGEDKVGALAHWRIGTTATDVATLRWCTALFPIVALQQRWPRVAATLLAGATNRTRPSSSLGDADFTDFERRLRTITDIWPTAASDLDQDEVDTKLHDEWFAQQLREVFPGHNHVDHELDLPDALSKFARSWFRLLDNSSQGDNVLTDDELATIARWSTRLGNMGVANIELTGIARLRRDWMEVDADAGDGFMALASHLLSTQQELNLVSGKADHRSVRFWIQTAYGQSGKLMSFHAKGDALEVRVNATPGMGERLALPELATAGNVLVDRLIEAGVEPRRIRRGKLAIQLADFAPGHTASRNHALRAAFGGFFEDVERLARQQPAPQVAALNPSPIPTAPPETLA